MLRIPNFASFSLIRAMPLLSAAVGALFLAAVPAAHAQQPDAVAVVRRCQGIVANMYKGLPKWPTSKDTAVIAAYMRLQDAHVDSVRGVINTCLSTVPVANVPANMLDSLAAVQRTAGDEGAAVASLQRMLHSNLPLERRVKGVWQSAIPLKGNAQVAAIWRDLVPMADTLGNTDLSMKMRLEVANAVRTYDAPAAYGAIGDVVRYVEGLDSAGRKVALDEIFRVIWQLNTWTIEDKGEVGIPLAGRIRALYPTFPSIAAIEKQVAHVNKPAPSMTSPYWLNAPPGTNKPITKGRVTLVEFTTAWCSSCKYTYDPIQKMTEELRAKGFDAMFVVPRAYAAEAPMDPTEPQPSAEPIDTVKAKYTKLFAHYNITFPIMIAETASYDEHYGVNSWPHFALIDRKGIIRDIWAGWQVARMEKRLQELLDEH